MAKVASRIRLRRSRCASEPSSDSASTDTASPVAGAIQSPTTDWPVLAVTSRTSGGALLTSSASLETIRMPVRVFTPQVPAGTDVSCCNGVRLDARSLALLEHVLVRSTPFSREWHWSWNMSQVSATVTDEQSAARELVRSWAAGSNAVKARPRRRAGRPRCVARAVRRPGPVGHLRRGDAGGGRRSRRHRRRPVRDGRGGCRRDGARARSPPPRSPRWWSRVRGPNCWRRWRPASAPPDWR